MQVRRDDGVAIPHQPLAVRGISGWTVGSQSRCGQAAAHCRHSLVDQEMFEHRAAEGPADERCHHRLSSAGRRSAQIKCAKISWTTDRLRIVFHHLAKRFHAGSQATTTRSSPRCSYRLELQLSRRDRSRCSKLVHGVAFLCGMSTPSLAAQGEQRRSVYFNINRDNSQGLGFRSG